MIVVMDIGGDFGSGLADGCEGANPSAFLFEGADERSQRPFCSGVYGAVYSCEMP